MYFIPIGLLIKNFDPTFVAVSGLDVSSLMSSTFLLKNLLPVTIANIIGGSLFVAVVYWTIFLRKTQTEI